MKATNNEYPNANKWFILISVILVVALILVAAITQNNKKEVKYSPAFLTPEGEVLLDSDITKSADLEKQKARFEKQFSVWNGSHKGLVKELKSMLHDPGSFEHVKTTYEINDDGTEMTVLMKYRANNAYGALRLSSVKATVSPFGNIWEIEEF